MDGRNWTTEKHISGGQTRQKIEKMLLGSAQACLNLIEFLHLNNSGDQSYLPSTVWNKFPMFIGWRGGLGTSGTGLSLQGSNSLSSG